MTILDVEINLVAVIISTIVAFALGAFWYSPLAFGDAWQKLVGLTAKQLQSNYKVTMAAGFGLVALIVFSFTLIAGLLSMPISFATGISSVLALNLITVLLLWALVILPPTVLNAAYASRPAKLIAIDMGYILIVMLVPAIVVGLVL